MDPFAERDPGAKKDRPQPGFSAHRHSGNLRLRKKLDHDVADHEIGDQNQQR
jgi:hypothetical protein